MWIPEDNATAHIADKTMTVTCEKSEKSNNQQKEYCIASYIPLVTLTSSAKELTGKAYNTIQDTSKVPQNKITSAAASIPKDELQSVSQNMQIIYEACPTNPVIHTKCHLLSSTG